MKTACRIPGTGSLCSVITALIFLLLPLELHAQNVNRQYASVNQEQNVSDQSERTDMDDILDLDIEQLGRVDVVVPSFDVEVTSVTKTKSTVGKSPAAIFVITQEMIRRNGATSIPEALRMAPGIQVAQIDASKWTVSARGFNGFASNKTLVLIDGRQIVTPLFEGVLFSSINWDAQDLVLEDIERIEVVRGPGGTLWGANAVNGVINIITKSAKDTHGTLVSAGGGTEDKSIVSVRQGGVINNDFHYRVFGKQLERDTFTNNRLDGTHGNYFPEGASDDWRQLRAGFRADWEVGGDKDELITIQGDYYQGKSGFSARFPDPVMPHEDLQIKDDTFIFGGNVLGRWTRTFDDETSTSLQMYYDNVNRESFHLYSHIDIFDVEWTNIFSPCDGHNVTWGTRFRSYNDSLDFQNEAYLNDNDRQSKNLYSVYIQDEIELIEETLSIWIGSKFDHNDYTGYEIQPNIRMLWTLDERQVIWGAISRAVRTPSRLEDDAQLNIGNHDHTFTVWQRFLGNRNLDAESIVAYELGYRAQPAEYFSWDVAAFYNQYDNLIAFNGPDINFIPPATIHSVDYFDNNMSGAAYGAEISGTINFTDWWRFMASYSYVQIIVDEEPGTDTSLIFEEGYTPHSQVFAQMSWDLPCNLEFDLSGRFVDKLPDPDPVVRGYFEMDARLGYRPNENWEFALIGQNLLNPSHEEFSQIFVAQNRAQRGIFAQVIWRR